MINKKMYIHFGYLTFLRGLRRACADPDPDPDPDPESESESESESDPNLNLVFFTFLSASLGCMPLSQRLLNISSSSALNA
jgi:hypothetical protein